MEDKRIAATIITFNEEKNIERCLKSLATLTDEIIVVDSGSADRTVEIARQYTDKIYTRKFDTYALQKNFAASKTKAEWVFSIDADEESTDELNKEMQMRIIGSNHNGFLIPRNNILLGKHMKHTRWSPDEHVWLWRKEKGKWIGDVHEEVHVEGSVGKLTHAKIHHQDETVSEFFSTINTYTEFEALQKIKQKTKFSLFYLFYDPLLSFFRRFVYKRGFLDGWRGFILSYMMSIYRLSTWVKVWEKQYGKN